jgi:hypothetical protein
MSGSTTTGCPTTGPRAGTSPGSPCPQVAIEAAEATTYTVDIAIDDRLRALDLTPSN